MPGYSPAQVANSVLNGNAVAIYLGDQVIMFAQTVGHQLPMGAEQLYGIGTSKPQEIQQLRMSPQFSLDNFAFTQAGLKLLANGTTLSYILAGNQFTMKVIDNQNFLRFVYVGAKCQNFSESIPANAPIRDTYTFLAMDVLNPQGQSIMDTGENAIEALVVGALTAASAVGNNLGLPPQA